MTQTGGRISCPKCGANNFDTVSMCWRCQTPLQASSMRPAVVERPGQVYQGAAPAMPMHIGGDMALARRSAVWLAISFPYFGMPIAWAFMMVNDREKQEIGQYCMKWSIVSMVVQSVLLWLACESLIPMIQTMFGGIAHIAAQNS